MSSDSVSSYGVTSMVSQLKVVALRRPGAILDADPQKWHYAGPIDAGALSAQFSGFVELLKSTGVVIRWLPDDPDDLADSIFTFDPSFLTASGAVLMRPGKELRRPEVELHRAFYRAEGIPILGEISAPGLLEGGDCMWLDSDTLAVGRGFRTNQVGIDQLAEILSGEGVSLEVFDLPSHLGPEACLHLLSIVNPLDDDLALVHRPLLPVALQMLMLERGYELLDVPIDEFHRSLGLSLNVLALAPRQVVAIDGFPETRATMKAHGCEVTVFAADELCLPCEGGPTCLTRPLLRG